MVALIYTTSMFFLCLTIYLSMEVWFGVTVILPDMRFFSFMRTIRNKNKQGSYLRSKKGDNQLCVVFEFLLNVIFAQLGEKIRGFAKKCPTSFMTFLTS